MKSNRKDRSARHLSTLYDLPSWRLTNAGTQQLTINSMACDTLELSKGMQTNTCHRQCQGEIALSGYAIRELTNLMYLQLCLANLTVCAEL